MKRVGKMSVCLLGSLSCCLGVLADDNTSPAPTTSTSTTSDNPYAAIVARNVFGIQPPPPPPAPVDPEIKDPPPKIIPNGIMNIFGTLQVLFKVDPVNKPGQPPAKEESYTLAEGEGQDDINVVKIDEQKAIITFNNHGYTQDIPLAAPPANTSPGSGGGGPGPSGIPMPRRGGFFGGGRPNRPMGMGMGDESNSGPSGNQPAQPTSNLGGGGNPSGGDNSDVLSPEAQAILMEKQRAEFEDAAGASGSKIPASAALLIPPTPLTQPLENERNQGSPPNP